MFPDFGSAIEAAANGTVDWLIREHGGFFDAVSGALLAAFLVVESALRAAPPWLIIAIVALLAFLAARRVLLAVVAGGGFWFIGALGLWDQAMQSLTIVLVAVAVCMAAGIPLGIAMAKNRATRAALSPVLDFMQTIPSFVYLIPVAMLLGLGKVPAIIATVVYALPPLARLTDLGLRLVDREMIEAAQAFGATRWQRLWGVELPLAVPNILQGVNQTTMMALAMVVIASMIGARGLGETVLIGLQRVDVGMGLVGGLAIVTLAIVLDRVTQALGARAPGARK